MSTAAGICLVLLTQVMIWFSANTQFMHERYAKHSFMICLLLSLPVSVCAYYATKYMYTGLGNESIWSVRLLIFGISTTTFAIMTSQFMNETLFNPKTMICLLLAFTIVWIQVAWR